MSQNWTIETASTDLPGLLKLARASSQYIVVPDGRFLVSFEQAGRKSLTDILDEEGRLKSADIREL
jgi:hypothetical protein